MTWLQTIAGLLALAGVAGVAVVVSIIASAPAEHHDQAPMPPGSRFVCHCRPPAHARGISRCLVPEVGSPDDWLTGNIGRWVGTTGPVTGHRRRR